MSQLYAYICTRTTSDPYVPQQAINIRQLSRDVSDAFVALSGGYYQVGQLVFYPLQRSVSSHLLCDGREVDRTAFPELFGYLGVSEGAPSVATKFKLPNFIAAASFVPAAAAVTETTSGSTTSTPPPAPTSPADIYGDVDSGGRRYLPGEAIP